MGKTETSDTPHKQQDGNSEIIFLNLASIDPEFTASYNFSDLGFKNSWTAAIKSQHHVHLHFLHSHTLQIGSGDLVDLLQLSKFKAWLPCPWQSRLNAIWVKEIIKCLSELASQRCKSVARPSLRGCPCVTVMCPCARGYMGQRVMPCSQWENPAT